MHILVLSQKAEIKLGEAQSVRNSGTWKSEGKLADIDALESPVLMQLLPDSVLVLTCVPSACD